METLYEEGDQEFTKKGSVISLIKMLSFPVEADLVTLCNEAVKLRGCLVGSH